MASLGVNDEEHADSLHESIWISINIKVLRVSRSKMLIFEIAWYCDEIRFRPISTSDSHCKNKIKRNFLISSKLKISAVLVGRQKTTIIWILLHNWLLINLKSFPCSQLCVVSVLFSLLAGGFNTSIWNDKAPISSDIFLASIYQCSLTPTPPASRHRKYGWKYPGILETLNSEL